MAEGSATQGSGTLAGAVQRLHIRDGEVVVVVRGGATG